MITHSPIVKMFYKV